MKSAKRSTPNSEYDYVGEAEGLKIEMKRALLAKRSEVFLTPEANIAQVKPENIISVTDPTPDELPDLPKYPAAPLRADDDTDETFATKLKTWEEGNARWEAELAARPPLKKLNVWAPVYHVIEARIDGMLLKVFHTMRGPMVGLVVSETSHDVTLYSPAYLDPNIQKQQVHFLPVAFAGYKITLHKPCFGESSPDMPIVFGFPRFMRANQQGDYILRTKGAYHHIEADFASYVHPVVKDVGMRELLRGILITSDTRQPQEMAKAAAMEAALKQRAADVAAAVHEASPE
jgi:hypothetical protein